MQKLQNANVQISEASIGIILKRIIQQVLSEVHSAAHALLPIMVLKQLCLQDINIITTMLPTTTTGVFQSFIWNMKVIIAIK